MMTIFVQTHWSQIGVMVDGTPMRACGVFDNDKVLGRVVDVGGGHYRADFINGDGNPQEIILPDYLTAVTRVVDEAVVRRRRMN
jgi:hypothetical protein